MSDSSAWTLPLGRWGHVSLRVHALFLVVAVFALYLTSHHLPDGGVGIGLVAVGILFGSVLLHELGHAFAAARVGGTAERIVIGPLGGLAAIDVPREPHAELITILAGLMVNLALLLLALPVLLFARADVAGLLAPVAPLGLLDGAWWLIGVKLAFWINWVLLLANLLPAFPLDGARIVRAALWPALDVRGATLVAVRVSKLTAVGLCLWAWLLGDQQAAAPLPGWMPLVLLAIYIYFCAAQEGAKSDEAEWNEDLFSYDFSQGYTSLERSDEPPPRPQGFVHRWLSQRRQARRQRRESIEREEERQVDEILTRLHESGMAGLSAKERALLDRVSARYRNRQQS